MKTIVLIALTVGLVAMVAAKPHDADIDKIKKIHDECQADPATKVDKDTMRKFYEGETVDEVQFGKHSLCMNIKMGIQNEQGDIDKEAFKKGLDGRTDSDKAQQIIDECGEKKGNTAEEAAFALAKCLRKYRPAPKHDHGHHH